MRSRASAKAARSSAAWRSRSLSIWREEHSEPLSASERGLPECVYGESSLGMHTCTPTAASPIFRPILPLLARHAALSLQGPLDILDERCTNFMQGFPCPSSLSSYFSNVLSIALRFSAKCAASRCLTCSPPRYGNVRVECASQGARWKDMAQGRAGGVQAWRRMVRDFWVFSKSAALTRRFSSSMR